MCKIDTIRPFTCINDRLLPQTKELMEEKDVLVVSLEPTIHANIFRDKERVVIQDFYMSTVRHPFFKWLLDDRSDKACLPTIYDCLRY
jgi:hypothetical protein